MNQPPSDKEPIPTIDLAPSFGVKSQFIGPYKILQPIAEGGMGSVFMAQQQKPVKRRVALKIIKSDGPRLDRREGIGKGPHAALRRCVRPGGRPTDRGSAALAGLPDSEVDSQVQGGGDDGKRRILPPGRWSGRNGQHGVAGQCCRTRREERSLEDTPSPGFCKKCAERSRHLY
jgi:hypothetical protein